MPTPPHSDYAHTPTLEDVALTPLQRVFKVHHLLRESRALEDLALVAKNRGWRFVSQNYSFKARVLQAHADYLISF